MLLTRRLRTALTTILAAVVLSSGMLTASPAVATTQENEKVGKMQAKYVPHPARDYRGFARSQFADPDQCVQVQRKSDTIGWTLSGVGTSGYNCSAEYFDWWITDDDVVAHTVAIRLKVTRGPFLGSYFNICSTKTQCLDMRFN